MAREVYGVEIPVNSENNKPATTEESLIEITPARDDLNTSVKNMGMISFHQCQHQ